MSTDFLSPSAAAALPAVSPLADPIRAAAAKTEVRDGWQVATSFGDPAAEAAACRDAVGFADLSHLGKLELQGTAERLDALATISAPGIASRVGKVWHCQVAPRLRLELHPAGGLAGRRDALEPSGIRVLDLTASLGAISVCGPRATETIARFCAIDTRPKSLPVSGFRPGSVARTPGYVLREGSDRFLLLFGAAYGTYMWEVVADAAERLGGRPVGLDSLPDLEETPDA